MTETWKLWGERILARRKALGLSQADVAGKLGVYQSNISRWERGNPPSDKMRLALAGILQSSIEELFPWPEPASSAVAS